MILKVINVLGVLGIVSMAVLYGISVGERIERKEAKKAIINIAIEASTKEELEMTTLNSETYAWYGVLEYYDMGRAKPEDYDIHNKK